MTLSALDPGSLGSRLATEQGPVGHDHFWERALTRAQALRGAGATAAALAAAGAAPDLARAFRGGHLPHGKELPRHVRGGIQPFGPGTRVFHIFLPGHRAEPLTITDFHGVVGIAEVQGHGRGRNLGTGKTRRLLYDVDLRFFKGTYVGRDEKVHHAAFSFV
jgi:hypothetical protein